MVWSKPAVKKEFPVFHRWLCNGFPKVTANKRVWRAFVKWSGLGQSADTYLSDGSMPEIMVEPLVGALGMFRKSDGDVIHIDSFMVSYFESNFHTDPKHSCRIAESTILHEMCHWAVRCGVLPLRKDDYGGGNIERGKHFERDAYGGDVGLLVTKGGATVTTTPFKVNPAKSH